MKRSEFFATSLGIAVLALIPAAPVTEYLLELDGQTWFPIYGSDGALSIEVMYYIGKYQGDRRVSIRTGTLNTKDMIRGGRFIGYSPGTYPDLNLPTRPMYEARK